MSSLDEKLKLLNESVSKKKEHYAAIDQLAEGLNAEHIKKLKQEAEAEYNISVSRVIHGVSGSTTHFRGTTSAATNNGGAQKLFSQSLKTQSKLKSIVESQESEEEASVASVSESPPKMLAKRSGLSKPIATAARNMVEDPRPKRQRIPSAPFDPDAPRLAEEDRLRQMMEPEDKEAYAELQTTFGDNWLQVFGKGEYKYKPDGVILNPRGTPYELRVKPAEGRDFFLTARSALEYCRQHCTPLQAKGGTRGSARRDK